MTEHEAIMAALTAGDANAASDALRDHVTVQGERFQSLMASLKSIAS
jgi:DNA-binding GntR family transcriptional regulator